jgi:hypothetical protein
VSVNWSDEVDEILGGDMAAGLAYLTPAKGVVIAPMAPLGLRDRDAGTVTLTTSLGLWTKLDRIRRNDGVAVAYHTREHGFSDRPGFVLVQGRASFDPRPDRAWLESITPAWNRFLAPRAGGLTGRLLNVYYWQRVAITIQVERVVAFADDAATGEPTVYGTPRPGPAPAQSPPGKGTAPRVDAGKVAADAKRLPHTLLGWCGSDGLPEIVPVGADAARADGVAILAPPGSVPIGGRRAGLTAHWFLPQMIGQEQRVHTGWLSAAEDGAVTYAPHTRAGYRVPPSKIIYTLGCASLAPRMRGARKAGFGG